MLGAGDECGAGGGLTSVITVIFLGESLQGRFSTRLTTTPLCPSLSLPVGRAQNTRWLKSVAPERDFVNIHTVYWSCVFFSRG